MKTLYNSQVTSKGGLRGHINSEDGSLDLDVFMPTGGDRQKQGTTPEQLFAASYASCLEGTLYHVAKLNNIDIQDTEVRANIQAVQVEKGDLRFKLDMQVNIPQLERKRAQHILDQAWKNCPLTKATQGNMDISCKLS